MIRNHTFIRLCRARDFLRENPSAILRMTDVARQANISTFHFIRAFKSAFGQTPHEFRTHVRIEKAKELLILDNHSITDICLELGYMSVGSFTSLFTNATGIPPSSYRRQLRTLVQVPGKFPHILMPYCFAMMYTGK